MKQPKKLTREQKKVLSKRGLDWADWALVEENIDILKIINKKTGEIKEIERKTRR